MEKRTYINPACVVVDMATESEILGMSQTGNNGDIGQKPIEGDGGAMDVKGQGNGNNLWEEW